MEGDKESTTELTSTDPGHSQAHPQAGTPKINGHEGPSDFREGIKPLRNSRLPNTTCGCACYFSPTSYQPLCLFFFLSLNSDGTTACKNGSRFSPSRTGPRAYRSALLSLCVRVKIMSNFPYIVDDGKSSIDSIPAGPPLPNDQPVARPPIDYSSFGALCHSTWRRFLSLWTRRFALSLLAGQVVSLCITCTNVTTEELTTGNWQLPTTQTFFLY